MNQSYDKTAKTFDELAIDKSLRDIDNNLYSVLGGVDILDAIAPINLLEEKQKFFDSHFSKSPEFRYKSQHLINTFSIKRNLFSLPLDTIVDSDLQKIYVDIVESYADKIDQLATLGDEKFLYDSLRYYGEPTVKDMRNAQFILHLPDSEHADEDELLNVDALVLMIEAFAKKYHYTYQLQIVDGMIAKALVSGTTVKISRTARLSKIDAEALVHHELGVHLVTTLNARAQPLKVLSLGCPLNTMTQEGMAILSEYKAGCLSIERLKTLALRVVAVDSMIKEKSFRKTFLLLKEQYNVSDEQAFTIVTRVYRGGGFTKDYLYLQGFHHMLHANESLHNFNHLLAGKASLDYLPNISALIAKGVLVEPKFITPAFSSPIKNTVIEDFIAHAIK